MNFKNKLMSKMPYAYIKSKTKSKDEAKLIYKGYKAIKENNLFDEEFYRKNYPKTSSMDSLLHYLFFGFAEGKKPFSDFDGAYYKNHYDIKINPLIHYALYGKDMGYSYKIINKSLECFKDFSKKSILFVLHEKINNVGGASFTNMDIIEGLDDSYSRFILTSDGVEVELWKYEDKLEKIAEWPVSYRTDFSLIDLDRSQKIITDEFEDYLFNNHLSLIYREILLKLDIDMIHINHFINHSFDLMNLAIENNIPYLINVHDFYYCCPTIHLLDNDFNFCNLSKSDSCGINIDDTSKIPDIIDIWQKYCFKLLKNAYLNIFPSNSSLDLYKEFYDDLTNIKVIEHGRNLKNNSKKSKLDKSKIKVLLPGHISPHKGSLLIPKIKEFDKNNQIEFHFAGTTIPNLNKYGINHGRYDRDNFNEIVNEIKPSFIAILSVCPETYSHTLTESLNAGIPVIATDLGALKERVEKYDAGWTVKSNPKEIYKKIVGIDEIDYSEKVANIDKIQFKSFEEMIKEYESIYNKMSC